MKRFTDRSTRFLWLGALLLLVISALSYLLFAGRLGYFKDDWYLMYSAHSQGPQFFKEIFQGDRPARAYVMLAAYTFFGEQALYYHLSGYLWRLLGALCFWWALRAIWPRQRTATWVMSLLFLIYPGFLSQINPIDYQSQLLALFLAMLSIALTINALQAAAPVPRIMWTLASISTTVVYLSLVEYMIGLEGLRFLFIVLFLERRAPRNWRERLTRAVKHGGVFLTGSLVFLLWRIFLFQNERRATDIGFQVEQFAGSPVYTGLWWFVNLFQDSMRVTLLAWVVPLYNLAFELRLRDALLGLALSTFAAWLVLRSTLLLEGADRPDEETDDWKREALWVGMGAAVIGLLPIVFANRHADFGDYSRYTLASSAGGAIMATALIYWFTSPRLRLIGVALLTFFAVFTHYANAVYGALETAIVRNFWWQVSWRAPMIEKGTTLVADYPLAAIQEDYFVWGPANLIYYPHEKSMTVPASVPLKAAVLMDQNVLRIFTGRGVETQIRRGLDVSRDYGDVLILTQATPEGCVRVLDGAQPELSSYDDYRIMLIAFRSKIKHVSPQAPPRVPIITVFGPEPPHRWCYYYQKASLARQAGDWEKVARLGSEALSQGYYPDDKIEWMPFLQADVVLHNQETLRQRASIINSDPFIKQQACNILSTTARDEEMHTFVRKMFCE